MERNTIDFGIDLGTTNSEISVLDGIRTEIIKNNINMDYTPSAVYIDKSNRIHVGQKAKDRSFYEDDDAYTEFKRDMGTDRNRLFKSSGITMKPEELSAEILKSLKADVAKRLNGENIQSAVITVPADFELPQNEATKQAAKLAGIENCHILQEPIAASLAYGFQSKNDKVFWLVYDFGGGTFDAALIQLRDGLFRVVHHQGDNFLGGKDLDWRIVEEIVVPQVLKQHKLENFSRCEEKWKSAFAKMKIAVENAKIQLSVEETSLLTIDNLIKESGIDFEMDLLQKDVARLAQPFILKSIRICKDVIKESKLKPGDIEKLILVGGPTLAPYLRDMLTDPKEGLGIPLEFSVDPLTVVARGAAIYAGTLLVERNDSIVLDAGTFQLDLEYQPIGSDSEPQIGGKISSAEIEDFSGYTIEISALNYNSGRTQLGKNGGFITTVLAVANKQNKYHIELFDSTGGKKIIVPDSFTYTIGNAPSNPPLAHSLGVALSNNEAEWFLKKGQPLPGRATKVLRSILDIKKGEDGNFIVIPVIEGVETVADLNRQIGSLIIPGTHIKRDVPAGSEVEITILVDKNGIITTRAYIPILDEEKEVILNIQLSSPDINELEKDLEVQKQKTSMLKEKAKQANEVGAQSQLRQLESERSISSIEDSLSGKEAVEAEKHLLSLKKQLASIENELEWPTLVREAEEEIESTTQMAEEQGDSILLNKTRILEKEISEAIQAKDAHVLKHKVEEMHSLRFSTIAEKPEFWVGYFYYLSQNQMETFTNQTRANELVIEGERAIQNGKLDRLKGVVVELINLLPQEKQEEIRRGYGSTVNK